MQIQITHGQPGSFCESCKQPEDTRFGCCWDCATAAEKKAAQRSVLHHFGRGLLGVLRLRWGFATRLNFVWAWERLTETGDYAPGGEFEQRYGVKL